MRVIVKVGAFSWFVAVCCWGLRGDEPPVLLDNNLRCVDLTGLTSSLPLEVTQATQILWRTEGWEHNTFDPIDDDSLGYTSLVKNEHGGNPDGRYYLYYAHHDPCSGIGCAVAESIEGPYRKLAVLDAGRRHSMVLANPHYPILKPPVSDPSHYSSPCVVWNGDEGLWFMYFHYYNHACDAWKAAGGAGYGHQMTALATCPDLSSHTWTVLKDPKVGKVSAWDLVPVLPTTESPWMNSQSSYHAVQRLADGQWLAFLRGTSVGQIVQLGFARSEDGRKWNYFQENPVIHPDTKGDGGKGVYRPFFVGFLGKGKSGKNEYLLAWGESPAEADRPSVMYGYTTDFIKVRRDPRGYAKWKVVADGPVSPWREGNRLYLFSGKHVQVMDLPVAAGASRPSARERSQRRRKRAAGPRYPQKHVCPERLRA